MFSVLWRLDTIKIYFCGVIVVLQPIKISPDGSTSVCLLLAFVSKLSLAVSQNLSDILCEIRFFPDNSIAGFGGAYFIKKRLFVDEAKAVAHIFQYIRWLRFVKRMLLSVSCFLCSR